MEARLSQWLKFSIVPRFQELDVACVRKFRVQGLTFGELQFPKKNMTHGKGERKLVSTSTLEAPMATSLSDTTKNGNLQLLTIQAQILTIY